MSDRRLPHRALQRGLASPRGAEASRDRHFDFLCICKRFLVLAVSQFGEGWDGNRRLLYGSNIQCGLSECPRRSREIGLNYWTAQDEEQVVAIDFSYRSNSCHRTSDVCASPRSGSNSETSDCCAYDAQQYLTSAQSRSCVGLFNFGCDRGGPRNSDQRLSDKKRWEEGEEKDNLNNQ